MPISVSELIRTERAAVRVIHAKYTNNGPLRTELNRVCRPTTNRGAKGDSTGRDYYNPKTGKVTTKVVNSHRGATKHTAQFSKKMSASLLPSNGKMHLFKISGKIGFLYDIDQCHLKDEKYMWTSNAYTDGRWWRTEPNYQPSLKRSVCLQGMRDANRKTARASKVPSHNEMLIGLSKNAMRAIFSPTDTLADRLNLLRFANQNKLDVGHCELWIITSINGAKPYTMAQQQADIDKANQQHSNTTENKMVRALPHKDFTLWTTSTTVNTPNNPNFALPVTTYSSLTDKNIVKQIASHKNYEHIYTARKQFADEKRPIIHRRMTDNVHAVTKLCHFIDHQIERLAKKSSHAAKKKCAAFIYIRRQCSNSNLSEGKIKILIRQACIVAHHRRHRTRNRLISWFAWGLRKSDSYKVYKNLTFKGAFQETHQDLVNGDRFCHVGRRTCFSYGELMTQLTA